ncbi:hypothetical protein GQ53DRAFT_157616 [Thozetella sp. PMI_491]|nr:hypothetical protein GQ53DRAFT_157616 [Thozetella sp. PMI_491]
MIRNLAISSRMDAACRCRPSQWRPPLLLLPIPHKAWVGSAQSHMQKHARGFACSQNGFLCLDTTPRLGSRGTGRARGSSRLPLLPRPRLSKAGNCRYAESQRDPLSVSVGKDGKAIFGRGPITSPYNAIFPVPRRPSSPSPRSMGAPAFVARWQSSLPTGGVLVSAREREAALSAPYRTVPVDSRSAICALGSRGGLLGSGFAPTQPPSSMISNNLGLSMTDLVI